MRGEAILFAREGVARVAFVVLALLVGCGPEEPIRIGFVAGTSGRVADLGISGRDAVQLLLDQVNADGGIRGRRIQLVARDDCQDPDTARKVVRELAEEGVEAIVGPMTSDMAWAVTPILNELRILGVSPTVSSEKLSGLDDYFFRITATTRENAGKSAAYHVRNRIFHHVAAAYDLNNEIYSENWLKNFQAAFTLPGNQLSTALGFRANDEMSFSNLADDLLSSNPNGILIIANSMDAALLCQQIRKRNTQVHITLSDWGATERLLELGGKAVEGVTVLQTFTRANSSPAYLAFRKTYIDRYGREPGFPGVYAHDAASVVFEALRRQHPGASLKDTVLAVRTFQSLQNEVTFDRFGDIERSHASISVVRDGRFVVLE